jgi:acyl phosphate:glycerol-3-phosphate acyltransferase
MVDTIYFKIIYIIASYLLGSVLFSYVMSAVYGRNSEKKDLGTIDRPGAAGAGRQYGLRAGIPTFIFDCGKGVAVVLIGKAIGLDLLVIAAACIAVIVGHNWPIWFKFRGGGGLAAGIGIAAALMFVPFLILLGISVAVGFTYKYTLGRYHRVNPNVVAGALGSFLFPVFAYIFDMPFIIIVTAIIIFLIILTKGIILHFTYRNVPTANKF